MNQTSSGSATADRDQQDDPSPDSRDRRRLWRSRILLFLVVLLVYGTSPVVTNGDSFLVAPTAYSLVHQHNLDIDEDLGTGTNGGIGYVTSDEQPDPGFVPGRQLPRQLPAGSHAYDFFPWTTAAVVTPLVVAFDIGARLGIRRLDLGRMVRDGDTGLFNLVGASLLTATIVLLVSTLAWEGLALSEPRRRRAALAVAVVAALGTPAWSVLSRALWNQTTSTLFLTAAVLAAIVLSRRDRDERPALANSTAFVFGATATAAFVTRPTNIASLAAFAVWLAVSHRRTLLAYVGGATAVALPWIAVNVLTYGRLQPPYFGSNRIGIASDTVEALAGNLVSPNRGLLVFTPIAVIAVWGFVLTRSRREAVEAPLALTCAGIVGAHLALVSATSDMWWAGASYGPRFMADMLPMLTLLSLPVVQRLAAGSLRRGLRVAVIALAALSVLMHLPGAWSKPAQCWSFDPVSVEDDPSRVWDWTDLAPLRPVRVMRDGGSPRDAVLQRCDALQAATTGSS